MGRRCPDNPLEFIRRCVEERRILWTYHVTMRLIGRFIPRRAIVDSLAAYEIIEEYREDKYLPSYLVYSQHRGDTLHVLFAVDIEGDNVRIVTAYRPSPEEWDETCKKRRDSP